MLEYFERTEESGHFLRHLHLRYQSGSSCTFSMYFQAKTCSTFVKFMHKRLVSLCLFSMVRLPKLYFWFDQFHLWYFDCCVPYVALFRKTLYYYKYNHKFPTYNRMTRTPEPFLSVYILFIKLYVFLFSACMQVI